MIEAKKGNIDNNYFKDIIQKSQILSHLPCFPPGDGEIKVNNITGWILDFFAYIKWGGHSERFSDRSLKVEDFDKLPSQMLFAPFIINEQITGKQYKMKYNVGFIGCDQNEKNEVFPVQGWIVSPSIL